VRYGTFCSGIEAPSVAWHTLGWHPQWFSEIEKFPCAVLKHHYPNVPNLGDMTKINGKDLTGTVDLVCAGTPCQSFSIAGKRAGLDDPRGNLALVFLRLVRDIQPRWFVWENVPGILSSGRGWDFGAILQTVGQCGYGWAYRILDAEYAGVPQRRRRVYLVGHLGDDWRPPAAVLFERESLCGNTQARRKEAKEVAGTVGGGSGKRGCCSDTDRNTFIPEHAPTLNANYGTKYGLDNQHIDGGAGLFVVFNVQTNDGGSHKRKDRPQGGMYVNEAYKALAVGSTDKTYVARVAPTLKGFGQGSGRAELSDGNGDGMISEGMSVRRLTPREAERLQGLPDDWTLIPWRGKPAEKCPDSPRYRTIGNSMPVPVLRWIGQRIETFEKCLDSKKGA